LIFQGKIKDEREKHTALETEAKIKIGWMQEEAKRK